MRNTLSIGIMGILLFCGVIAKAEPITIQIWGNVTSAHGSALPSTIYENVSFTGTYTYDNSATDSEPDPMRGIYQYDSPYGMSILVGGYEFKTDPDHVGQFKIQITNNSLVNGLHDYYSVLSQYQNVSIPSVGFNIGYITWTLGNSSGTALSSDALPVTAPMLANWDYNRFEIFGSGSGLGGLTIEGIVTQATLIPEPVTGILMAMGMLFFRRR
jgi:hypothetical protein